ncbi:acyl-CoA dehydrogenase family protein [Thermobifida halotolerans]|uniref:Acyl-CoA dehydrogenase family protein n=1 Tax=Thermobifida halotolerans TaxID=483545 RepID=A0A399FZM7_9ACTN|nr:acyl-CoA dehydrogenase family protein [Thermobifida halotolerans]UOE21251.1 acyl-CoA dehydrogenase family protein [Thermobifida halotolerans]
MQRTLFDTVHNDFRDSVREFVRRNVVSEYERWEAEGLVDRELWKLAGESGFLGTAVPAEYGGGGEPDFRYNAVLVEEFARAGALSLSSGFGLHNDVVAPYLLELGTEEQKQRWLPGFCSGDVVTAIAMTEPGAGSDLKAVRTTATRDGDHYVLNGTKTFITNGIHSDIVIVVAKTDPSAGARGVSLLVVERGMPGFRRGRNLAKAGMHSQDTAELVFEDVRVPASNLLGEENRGFGYLMRNLPQERLSIAVVAVSAAQAAFDWTVRYCHERKAFGQEIGSFQNSRFRLAEMATEIEMAQTYVDRAVLELNAGTLSPVDAAKAKWWTTELMKRTADTCLQLHGGYGYMDEYPISRFWRDARIHTIFGGTTEIMKEIIGRDLGF